MKLMKYTLKDVMDLANQVIDLIRIRKGIIINFSFVGNRFELLDKTDLPYPNGMIISIGKREFYEKLSIMQEILT